MQFKVPVQQPASSGRNSEQEIAQSIGLAPATESALDREREVRAARIWRRGRLVSPTLKVRLVALADRINADELMVITITGNYRTRIESDESMAVAFRICQRNGFARVKHFAPGV